MVANPKPYPSMKESDVKWIGQLPAHWQVRRLKTVALILNGATPSSGTPTYWNGDISWITPEDLGVLSSRYIRHSARRITREGYYSCGTSLAPAGSIAISTRAPIGHIGILTSPACVNQGCKLLIPSESLYSTYLFYLLEAGKLELKSRGEGTTFAELSRGRLGNLWLPVPPPVEQSAVVRFLNYADQRIRGYIRTKQKLVELLLEQKQAIIHQAVTGQIDVRSGRPYPTYVASDVGWLGGVPSNWAVRKLKHLMTFANGIAFKPSEWREEGVPIIRIENLNGSDAFNYTDRVDLPDTLLIRPGDLVFAWSGNRGTSFGSFEWDRSYPGYLNQHIFKLDNYRLQRRYLFYLLRAVTKNIEDNAHGIIGLVHITKPALGATPVPVAPSQEQIAIAEWLDDRLTVLSDAVDHIKMSIRSAGEFRTRLTGDVVTGKLDVREAAAALPQEGPVASGGEGCYA